MQADLIAAEIAAAHRNMNPTERASCSCLGCRAAHLAQKAANRADMAARRRADLRGPRTYPCPVDDAKVLR